MISFDHYESWINVKAGFQQVKIILYEATFLRMCVFLQPTEQNFNFTLKKLEKWNDFI